MKKNIFYQSMCRYHMCNCVPFQCCKCFIGRLFGFHHELDTSKILFFPPFQEIVYSTLYLYTSLLVQCISIYYYVKLHTFLPYISEKFTNQAKEKKQQQQHISIRIPAGHSHKCGAYVCHISRNTKEKLLFV